MSFKEQLLQINRTQALDLTETQIHQRVETMISKTFMWMWFVLLIAFGLAYAIGTQLIPIPLNMGIFWWTAIAGFIIVMVMSRKRQRLSYTSLAVLLLLFGVLEWYGLSWVFLAYSIGSITQVFLTTSVMFLWLAFTGYRLHIDITRVWPILMWALIGLIVSMLINMFWHNAVFDLWINIIGVVVFSGMIIYDLARLKQMALIGDKKIELLMALSLFLDFINLFLFLLRLMGRRR